MIYVYILHFDKPLHHAKHYTGVTGDLEERLKQHAAGSACRLTEVIHEAGIGWKLGALYYTTESLTPRQAELLIKNQRQSSRFCTICTPKSRRKPRLLIEYPLSLLKIDTCSAQIKHRKSIFEGS